MKSKQNFTKVKTGTPSKMVVVAVPIYKDFVHLSPEEMNVLVQLTTVLGTRDICFLYPKSVDIEIYLKAFSSPNVTALRLHSRYFGNMFRGNSLAMSYSLFKDFSDYKYLLLHHLDAFVFSDQLDYWCGKDYDYIGAPWILPAEETTADGQQVDQIAFKGVGNGGFSLRKVASFTVIIRNKFFMFRHTQLHYLYKFLEFRYRPKWSLNPLSMVWRGVRKFTIYEDEFWGMSIPRYFKWFKVAPVNDAIKFSFEQQPGKLYVLNNHKLPFGCHAWEKYDPGFWKSHIPQNNTVVQELNDHHYNLTTLPGFTSADTKIQAII